MVGYASAGGMVLGFKDILAQLIARDIQESCFRGWEERLPYAASYIEIMVFRYLFLVLGPDFLFSFVNHLLMIEMFRAALGIEFLAVFFFRKSKFGSLL